MTEFALRFVQAPLCRGVLEGATHYGESDPPGEGPYVQIWLRIESGVIQDASFQSPGCPSSRGCGGVLCALVKGREVSAVTSLTQDDLLAVVGELPDGKGHYADRAISALKRAIGES
jgi:NifU-like protein